MIHLKIGGSTAARTLHCPAWFDKSKSLPKHPPGLAAIEGSMHHEVMEHCQTQGKKPADLIGLLYREAGIVRKFEPSDLDLSNTAFNATNAILSELEITDIEFESFVQLVEDFAGTAIDVLGLSEDRTHILCLDYKFGRSAVDATENAQLLFGLVAARMDSNTADLFERADTFTIAIVQPQLSSVPLRWTCTDVELDVFEHEFGKAISHVMAIEDGQEEAIGVPGPHCDWCPAAPYCQERRVSVIALIALNPLDQDELNESAKYIKEVEDWLALTKKEMFLQMSRGIVVNGWKVVEKQAKRTWKDENAAEQFLRNIKLRVKDIKKTSLITAPAAIELLKKKKLAINLLDFLIEKTSSGNTIAQDSDKRDAVVVTDVQGHLNEVMKGSGHEGTSQTITVTSTKKPTLQS